MRIDSPIMSNAIITGSFSGSIDGTLASTVDVTLALPDGVISGSEQFNALLPGGLVSGSDQVTALLPDGVISGSDQLPAGIVSSSQQIAPLLPEGVISGSSQLPSGVVSGSSQIVLQNADKAGFTGATSIITLGEVTTGDVTAILPSGVISGSDQIATTFAQTILDDGDAATVRATIGVDAAGTDNSDPVSLSTGSHDYLSISGQAITLLQIENNDLANSSITINGTETALGSSYNVTAADVGLENVTNESKATMFTNAALTGAPTAPTQDGTDDSTKIATTEFVQGRITALIGTAGSTLDTLGELSSSLAQDSGSLASLVTTVGTKLAKDQNLADLQDASTARTNLGVDAAGTDNSTNVTLDTSSYDYLSITGQEITLGQIDASTDISNLSTENVSEHSSKLFYTDTRVKNKLNAEGVISGSEQITITQSQISDLDHYTDADVKAKLNSEGVISGSEQITITQSQISDLDHYTDSDVLSYINSLGVQSGSDTPHYTDSDTLSYLNSISVVSGSASEVRSFINVEDGADVTDSTNVVSSLVSATAITSGNKTTIQSNLGVDAAGTDNSTNVSLAGTLDYITINGQEITRNAINLTTDVTGTLPIANGGTGATTAAAARTALGVDTKANTYTGVSGDITITSAGVATVADDSHNHVISNVDGLQAALDAKQASGTYNTIIGTDTDLDTSGAEVVDQINVTDGVIQSMSKRTMTLGDLGYTGATDANNYSHPTYTARSVDTSGALVLDTFTSDTSGHVTGISTRTLTLGDLGYTGATDANNYVHPTLTARSVSTSGADVLATFTSNTAGHVTGITTRTMTLSDLGYSGDTNATITSTANVKAALNASLDTLTLGDSNDTISIPGNLTVSGTTNFINSQTLNIGDNNIVLNADVTGTPSSNGGITIERGTSTNATLIWDETNDYWKAGLAGAEVQLALVNGTYSGLRAQATTKADVGLSNVENTALSSWAGSANLTTLGTVTTGTWGATDIAVAHGGTGASTAAAARTNLGLAIGSDVQAYNATLAAVANGSYTGDDSITTVGTIGTGVWSGTDVAVAHGGTGASTAAAARTNLGLAIGTDVQAYNATLAAVAAGTYTGDDSITTVGTIGTGTWNASTIAIAKGGTGATTAAAAATNLGLGTGDTPTFAGINSSGNIMPTTDNSGNVGDATYTWANGRFTNFQVDSTLTVRSYIDLADSDGIRFGSTDDYRHFYNGTTNELNMEMETACVGMIITDNGTEKFRFNKNGTFSATGDVVAYASSDERLKDNVTEIAGALDKVEALRGVSFDWNDNQDVYQGHDLGVIAQEVEAVLPELVQTRDNGYKAVKYEKLTAVLIQAVKELSTRVKELENK